MEQTAASCPLPVGGTVPSHLHGAGPGGTRSQAVGQQHDRRRLAPPPELSPGTKLPGRAAGDGHHGNARERAQRFPCVADDRRAPEVNDGALMNEVCVCSDVIYIHL